MATGRYIVQRDTTAWRMQVRLSFILAIVCAGVGVINMPGQDLDRAFLVIDLFFCMVATFSVVKSQRANLDGPVDSLMRWIGVWMGFSGASSSCNNCRC